MVFGPERRFLTLETPQRILMIRPSALGDVCRTVPALASLKAAFPAALIDWVVHQAYLPVVAAHPALHRAIAFPRGRFRAWWRRPWIIGEMLSWGNQLRRGQYDMVFDLQGLARSGVMAWATRAPRRVGFRSAREFGWLGSNRRIEGPKATHTVDQMLELLSAEGIEPVHDMRLFAQEQDAAWWAAWSDDRGFVAKSRYAVLAPTARWESKRWPLDRWAQLLRPLAERGYERIVVLGAPEEVEQVRPLLESLEACDVGSVVDLVGRTSIGQTMAVIQRAGLVVANDSAPLHMAVGFDRPCIGLFGPTDPAFVGPYRRSRAVVRKWQPKPGEDVNFRSASLGDRLMRLIEVSDVVAAIDDDRLAEWDTPVVQSSAVAYRPPGAQPDLAGDAVR